MRSYEDATFANTLFTSPDLSFSGTSLYPAMQWHVGGLFEADRALSLQGVQEHTRNVVTLKYIMR